MPTWGSGAVVRSFGGLESVPGALADWGPEFRGVLRRASCRASSSNDCFLSVRRCISRALSAVHSRIQSATGDRKALDLVIEPASYPLRFWPTDFGAACCRRAPPAPNRGRPRAALGPLTSSPGRSGFHSNIRYPVRRFEGFCGSGRSYVRRGAGPDLAQVGLSGNERLRWKSVGQNRSG